MLTSACISRLLIAIRRYVLEQILSGEATENVVENIHEYLTTMGTSVLEGKIKLDEFIIYKVRPTVATLLTACSQPS